MTLEERITQDLKTAMKEKDKVALRGIRAVKQAILLAKTDGSGEELDANKEIAMLQKLVKQRKESLEIYEQQNREDLASVEREEMEIIQRYLPKQLSDEELEQEVKAIIEETGATSMRDMSKIMPIAMERFAGSADGKAVSAMVKKLLS